MSIRSWFCWLWGPCGCGVGQSPLFTGRWAVWWWWCVLCRRDRRVVEAFGGGSDRMVWCSVLTLLLDWVGRAVGLTGLLTST